MTPSQVSQRTVADRMAVITEMLRVIRGLPLTTLDQFLADERNVWSAESCLRRSLEALLDIGRHILAKGYGIGASEYKAIATNLQRVAALSADEAQRLRQMAGYRNRLVHFYNEIDAEELFQICTHNLNDLELLQDAYRRWLHTHPDRVDRSL